MHKKIHNRTILGGIFLAMAFASPNASAGAGAKANVVPGEATPTPTASPTMNPYANPICLETAKTNPVANCTMSAIGGYTAGTPVETVLAGISACGCSAGLYGSIGIKDDRNRKEVFERYIVSCPGTPEVAINFSPVFPEFTSVAVSNGENPPLACEIIVKAKTSPVVNPNAQNCRKCHTTRQTLDDFFLEPGVLKNYKPAATPTPAPTETPAPTPVPAPTESEN